MDKRWTSDKLRRTSDGIQVRPYDEVWEILWRYDNAEVSTPRPDCKRVRDIPVGVKFWRKRRNCELAIKQLLKHPKPSNYISPLRYPHLQPDSQANYPSI